MSILKTGDNDRGSSQQTHQAHETQACTGDTSIRFVLVETSRPGNIGAAARAMKTMGYTQLVLVRPRFPAPAQEPEAIAFASGAIDVLEAALVVESMQAALAGCNHVAAVSARLRQFSPPVMTPRIWATSYVENAESNGCRAALVFGNERFGLPNDVVEKCDVLINIPANPAYSSLNLAQAVQILSYECAVASDLGASNFGTSNPGADELAAGDIAARLPTNIGFAGRAADRTQIDAMFDHLEQALVAIAFIDPQHPKKLMSRLRRLFARTQLETEEVNILRGIANRILKLRGP